MISQSELVESFFGYWPEFADAKLLKVAWSQGGSLELSLRYIDAALEKDAIVGLRFVGVSEVNLTDLASENVVDRLSISPGDPIVVELEACIGLSGSFQCSGAEVTEVAPNNSSKPTPLRGAA